MFQLMWIMQESMVCAKIGDLLNLNNFPHMDVVTFDIFSKLCHKTEDIVKHHNHDPTLKQHQT